MCGASGMCSDCYVRQVPFGRVLLGPVLGAKDILTDPAGAGRRRPVFELYPASSS